MKKLCVIVLWCVCAVSCSAQTSWKEDITFFGSELSEKHKNLFFRLDRQDFEKNWMPCLLNPMAWMI